MKANIFFAVLLLFILNGCTSTQRDQLTQQQKDQIKSEVKVVVDSIFAQWARLDADRCFQNYSPELVVVFDSTRLDFDAYRKMCVEYIPLLTATKWTKVRVDVIPLSPDLAVCTAVWNSKDSLKSGDTETWNPVTYTLLFKKSEGHWKVTYSHASGIPVTEKAGKK
jgi:ketosteroid isomerase-like protein